MTRDSQQSLSVIKWMDMFVLDLLDRQLYKYRFGPLQRIQAYNRPHKL
jgi:hypothetical protein